MCFIFPLIHTSDITGRVNVAYLSHQTCMELFIGDSAIGQTYKDEFGNFEDIKEWNEIELDSDGRVISYNSNVRFWICATYPGGRVLFDALPETLQTLCISCFALEGTICTENLPRALRSFDVEDNQLSGPFDATSLPETLITLNITSNKLEGSLQLQALPHYLHDFRASDNRFSGSLVLHRLPKKLSKFQIARNSFSGTIELTNFPPKIKTFDISGNKFEQDRVVIGRIPMTLTRFELGSLQKAIFVDSDGFQVNRTPKKN